MSKPRNWEDLPFHAHEYPTISWFPAAQTLGQVQTLDLPDVTEEARGLTPARKAREEEPEVPPVDVEQELQAVRELAHSEGRAQGRAEAEAEHEKALERMKRRMDGVVQAMRSGLDRAEADSDRDAVRLAILVAEHVLRRKLVEDPEAVASSLGPTANCMEGLEPITLYCEASGFEELRSHLAVLQDGLQIAEVDLQLDDALQPGDYLLKRGDETADARLGPRLDRLRRRLLEALGLDDAPEAP